MASPTLTGSSKPQHSKQALSQEELRKMHAYWRAAKLSLGWPNLSLCQSLLQDR